ncbi:hypothetical protein ACFYYB_26575 [Streptomyces sp. NPDC002886]|uniref:hypothetical protein n=1 Tax=Streptomyces sp. NPDC002886 TaxID=3364667 RepID=UPI003695F9E1
MQQQPLWAFRAVGIRGTPAGDLALLVFTHDGQLTHRRGNHGTHELLATMGMAPYNPVVEDLLRPLPAWSACANDESVTIRYHGEVFYQPRPGHVPATWTEMAITTGRVVLVFLPGRHRPDAPDVFTMLRQGAGLWGTVALTQKGSRHCAHLDR